MLLLRLLALNLWLRPLEADPFPTPIDEGNASAAYDFFADFGTQSRPVDGCSIFQAPSEKATNHLKLELSLASLSSTGKVQTATRNFLNLDLTLGSPARTGQVHTVHSQDGQGGSKDLAPAVDQPCSHSHHSSATKASEHHRISFPQSTALEKSPTAASPSYSTPHLTPLGISEENHPVPWKRPQTLPEDNEEHSRSPSDGSDVPMLDRERSVEHSGGGNDQATQSLHRGAQSFQDKAQSLHKESDSLSKGSQSLLEEVDSLRKQAESSHEEAYSSHSDASPIKDDSVNVGRFRHERKRAREEGSSSQPGMTPSKSRSQRDRSQILKIGWIPKAEPQNSPKRLKEMEEFSTHQVQDRYPEEEILLQKLKTYPTTRELSFNFFTQTAQDYYEGIQGALCGMTIFKYPENGLFIRPNSNEDKRIQSIFNQAYKNGKQELELIGRPDTFKQIAENVAERKAGKSSIKAHDYPKLKMNIRGRRFYRLREWLNHCLPFMIHDIRVLCEIFPKIVVDQQTSVKDIQRNAWDFYAFLWNHVDSIGIKGSKINQKFKKSIMSLNTVNLLIEKIDQKKLSNMGYKYSSATARKFITIWLPFFDGKLYKKASKGRREEINTHFIGIMNSFYEHEV